MVTYGYKCHNFNKVEGRPIYALFLQAILPLLYRDSTSMPENFEQKLNEMKTTYTHWSARMSQYPHTAERMCRDYFNLFKELLDNRPSLLQDRVWPRQPATLMRALFPEWANALWCRYRRKVGSEGSTVDPS